MYAVQSNETIRIYDSYLYKESIKEIDGRQYDAEDKCWVVPLSCENVATYKKVYFIVNYSFSLKIIKNSLIC